MNESLEKSFRGDVASDVIVAGDPVYIAENSRIMYIVEFSEGRWPVDGQFDQLLFAMHRDLVLAL